MLSLLVCCLLVDPVPASSYKIIHTRTGTELTLAQLADELALRDVVYFGELHDNVVGHRVYAELATLLHDRRGDLVISMEMFERDVQGVVNDYVRGRLDEPGFLKHSRPWKDYARDYRPLIELARAKKLDVIAGNIPRPVAARVSSKEGSNSPYLPRKVTAPNDRYRELFEDAMKGHPGADGMAERMYLAQCTKDDAMAEGMADYLLSNPHRQPLVVHCNGNFHSDYGLGTAARLMQRVPLAQQSIISMVGAVDITKADLSKEFKKGHYLLIVPKPAQLQPEKKPEMKTEKAPPKK
jgi:uncharacterized iron-regulated protein